MDLSLGIVTTVLVPAIPMTGCRAARIEKQVAAWYGGERYVTHDGCLVLRSE